MNGAPPEMLLSFEVDPESVGAARRAVAEYAVGLGMTDPRLGDLRTTVTEAASNVVRHAYPAGGGTFNVEAWPKQGCLTVIVRDSGVGLRPLLADTEPCSRLGLGLISVLADAYEIVGQADGGTEVRFTLTL